MVHRLPITQSGSGLGARASASLPFRAPRPPEIKQKDQASTKVLARGWQTHPFRAPRTRLRANHAGYHKMSWCADDQPVRSEHRNTMRIARYTSSQEANPKTETPQLLRELNTLNNILTHSAQPTPTNHRGQDTGTPQFAPGCLT